MFLKAKLPAQRLRAGRGFVVVVVVNVGAGVRRLQKAVVHGCPQGTSEARNFASCSLTSRCGNIRRIDRLLELRLQGKLVGGRRGGAHAPAGTRRTGPGVPIDRIITVPVPAFDPFKIQLKKRWGPHCLGADVTLCAPTLIYCRTFLLLIWAERRLPHSLAPRRPPTRHPGSAAVSEGRRRPTSPGARRSCRPRRGTGG